MRCINKILVESTAFLAAFYFILFPRFYAEERRQIIGELFLVLLIFTILSNKISLKKKELLIGVFGIALVVSHYSTFDVFVFCALFALVAMFLIDLIPRILPRIKTSKITKILSPRIVIIILTVGILWFTFASTSLDQTFVNFASRLINSFQSGFSNVGSRGNTVSDFVSSGSNTTTLTYQLDYYINKIPYLFLGLGLLAFIVNRKKLKIQSEYFFMVFAVLLILILTFILPSLADSFVEERFFHLALIFLAPVFFYGSILALTWVSKHFTTPKRARSIAIGLICILFIIIFFFKVGFVNEIAGDLGPGSSASFSFAATINSSDPTVLASFYSEYVPTQEVYGARWLSSIMGPNSIVYSDSDARQHVLRGYGLFVVSGNNLFANNSLFSPNSYVFLRTLNVEGYYVNSLGGVSNMTQINNQLVNADKIYSDGGSEIYYCNSR